MGVVESGLALVLVAVGDLAGPEVVGAVVAAASSVSAS